MVGEPTQPKIMSVGHWVMEQDLEQVVEQVGEWVVERVRKWAVEQVGERDPNLT